MSYPKFHEGELVLIARCRSAEHLIGRKARITGGLRERPAKPLHSLQIVRMQGYEAVIVADQTKVILSEECLDKVFVPVTWEEIEEDCGWKKPEL